MLFQHPLIHAAPKWQRGKIARAIAAKVAIAARIDAYRHAEKDPHIADKLKKRILEIQQKNKLPPSEEERFRKSQEHRKRQVEYSGPRGGRRQDQPWKRGRPQYQEHRRHRQFQRPPFQGPPRVSEDQREGSSSGDHTFHKPPTDWRSDSPNRMSKKNKKKRFRKGF